MLCGCWTFTICGDKTAKGGLTGLHKDLSCLMTKDNLTRLSEILKGSPDPYALWTSDDGVVVPGYSLAMPDIDEIEFDQYGPLDEYFTSEAMRLICLGASTSGSFEMLQALSDTLLDVLGEESPTLGAAVVISSVVAHSLLKYYGYRITGLIDTILSGKYKPLGTSDGTSGTKKGDVDRRVPNEN